jgi:hypothetical protein
MSSMESKANECSSCSINTSPFFLPVSIVPSRTRSLCLQLLFTAMTRSLRFL